MQRGSIFANHGAWYLRWYEGGRRVTKRLGSMEDYPTQRLVEPLAQDEMRKVNSSENPAITLEDFVQLVFLPWAERETRPSTYRGYKTLYASYVAGRTSCRHKVRDYNTAMVQTILNGIVDARPTLTRTTLSHVKAFFSGVFVKAAQHGLRDGNPVREARLPRKAASSDPAKTYAYSLPELQKMLLVMRGQLKAAIAVAGLAGLRLSELHGLQWADYNGAELNVVRSVWRGHASETKSAASRDYVPVVPALREMLNAWRDEATVWRTRLVGEPVLMGTTPADRIFSNLDSWPTRRLINASLSGTGLSWRGWHSFRRGLASNLFEMGVDDLTVQRILRHAKVTVTREHYIKRRSLPMEAAMKKLNEAFGLPLGNA
jgi:integrase